MLKGFLCISSYTSGETQKYFHRLLPCIDSPQRIAYKSLKIKQILEPGMPDHAEISKKIADCLIASAWLKPETQVTDNSEIYKIVNPIAPYEFLNGIYRTDF